MVPLNFNGPTITHLHYDAAILGAIKKCGGIVVGLSGYCFLRLNQVGNGFLNGLLTTADQGRGPDRESHQLQKITTRCTGFNYLAVQQVQYGILMLLSSAVLLLHPAIFVLFNTSPMLFHGYCSV